MSAHQLVSLDKLMEEFDLTLLTKGITVGDKKLLHPEINRPALQFAGFFDYFDSDRLQVVGIVEYTYLQRLPEDTRRENLRRIFASKIPCLIMCRSLPLLPEMDQYATEFDVPIFSSSDITTDFTGEVIRWLRTQMAPRTQIHGVLLDVYGVGVLIMGDSGVGKSETALEMIKRGHRFIADDAVEIKRVSNETLVGSCPQNIQYFLELRGIGIIDVQRMYGVESVRATQSIDLIIKLEMWDERREYDRIGLIYDYMEILGNKVTCHSVPIRPGRNLAIICEAAALNHRQRKMGYNAASALTDRIMEGIGGKHGSSCFGLEDNLEKILSMKIPGDRISTKEPMSEHTTFKIGGPANVYVQPATKDEVIWVIERCKENKEPFMVLGNGSNILVPDEGLSFVVIQLYPHFSGCKIEGTCLEAEAGASLSAVADKAWQEGLAGLEFASGIPGTVGGAVCMNAGAYDHDISGVCVSVDMLLQNGQVVTVPAEEMEFGYRSSILQKNGAVVLSAKFALKTGDKAAIRAYMDDLNQRRRDSQPLEFPSAGSVFKRPPGHFAGKLISDCGLKGLAVGGAMVSEKHGGFIVNTGGATASDVIELIKLIQAKVLERYGVTLDPEVKILCNL